MKKGFTLVEMITIIIILSILTLISFSAMTSTIKKMDVKNTETFVNSIINSASMYVETNRDKYDFSTTVNISVNDLIINGYLQSNIDNPTECDLENVIVHVYLDSDASSTSYGALRYSVYCDTELLGDDTNN